MSEARKARAKLLLLAALFFAPFVAAVAIFFYFPELIPDKRGNYGRLVSPARAVPMLDLVDSAGVAAPMALQGKWTLVHLGGDRCGESCQAQVALTRQVRLALNQNRARVQRVYLAPSRAALDAARAALGPEHPDLVFVAEAGGRAQAFFEPAEPDAIHLLDPLGNWLMSYPAGAEHKGLHRDLKKLLRFSQVG